MFSSATLATCYELERSALLRTLLISRNLSHDKSIFSLECVSWIPNTLCDALTDNCFRHRPDGRLSINLSQSPQKRSACLHVDRHMHTWFETNTCALCRTTVQSLRKTDRINFDWLNCHIARALLGRLCSRMRLKAGYIYGTIIYRKTMMTYSEMKVISQQFGCRSQLSSNDAMSE